MIRSVRLAICVGAILSTFHGLAGCLLTSNADGLTGGGVGGGNEASSDAPVGDSSDASARDVFSEQAWDAQDSLSVLPEVVPDIALQDSTPGNDAIVDARSESESGLPDAKQDVVYPEDALDGCPPNTKLCGETCSPFNNPATGCAGASCQPCEFYKGDAICILGACALGSCREAWKNCDTDDTTGCETDSLVSLGNCGGCGHQCLVAQHSTPQCVSSSCEVNCSAGWANCDKDPTTGCEQNTSTNMDNCGGCGKACFAGAHVDDANCANGTCELDCDMMFLDCDLDPTTGCEHEDSPFDCGCGHVKCPSFPHVYPNCWGGQCYGLCIEGWTECDGLESTGCEKQELASDCGCAHLVCGSEVSHTRPSCKYDKCACEDGFDDCDKNQANGCEVNVDSDPSNCGVCGRKCGPSLSCMTGSCIS